jgi:cellulose biosynthesis protein BcsQ
MIGREETGGSQVHGHVPHQYGRLGGTGLPELTDNGVRNADAVLSPASRTAADRLGTTLDKMFVEANAEYDLIIVDAPPLLGFAEPLQMAVVVDGVVVMALAGQTNRNAVNGVLASLKRVKANVIGMALNEVRKDMSDRYYYYGYYGKYYSKYYKPTKA